MQKASLSVGNTQVDVIVIGAGIQGAGIAQACAAQGWKVCVLERNSQPGLETSSASSKLVHGGLRYLETLQVKLVYECLRERQYLLKNAPKLVKLTPFYIPVYKKTQRNAWWVFAGLSLYALLGGLKKTARFRRVPHHEWQALGLDQSSLSAVFQYYDGQTDDRALTEAVIASAQKMGARVQYGVNVNSVLQEENVYTIETPSGPVSARCVINACGPWVNACAQSVPQAPTAPLDWVQGVHIVLPVTCEKGCFYFESVTDGRPMFVLPWKGKTLVGTTERILTSAKAEATEAEIQYLLTSYNAYFTRLAEARGIDSQSIAPQSTELQSTALRNPITRNDVEKVMAGVRVLPLNESTAANQRKRETVFTERVVGGTLYLGVYGGKLTSYRAMAERVARKIAPVLKQPFDHALSTKNIKIT